jgi:hypothetical protein
LSALTGGVRVPCKRPARRQSGPRSGAHLGTSAATARSAGYCSRFPNGSRQHPAAFTLKNCQAPMTVRFSHCNAPIT